MGYIIGQVSFSYLWLDILLSLYLSSTRYFLQFSWFLQLVIIYIKTQRISLRIVILSYRFFHFSIFSSFTHSFVYCCFFSDTAFPGQVLPLIPLWYWGLRRKCHAHCSRSISYNAVHPHNKNPIPAHTHSISPCFSLSSLPLTSLLHFQYIRAGK